MKIIGLKKVKFQMMNTCLTLQNCNRTCKNPVFQKSLWKKTDQEKNHQIQRKTLVGLEILSGALVVNTDQWLLMQKALAAWINMKFVKVISKAYFHSFFKYFYSANIFMVVFCLLWIISGRIVFLWKILRWNIFSVANSCFNL